MSKGNNDWLDLIRRLPGWITGVIVFVTSIVGFVNLWRGDTGLVTIVLLVIGVSGAMLSCAYVALKRDPPEFGGKGPLKYAQQWRRWALRGLIAVPLATAGGVGYYVHRQAQTPNEIIILVANFDGPEDYGVTETVLERLDQALRPYDGVSVEPLGRAISVSQVDQETGEIGSSAARAAGEKKYATIVIWGWYRVTGKGVLVSTHFESLGGHEWVTDILEVREGEEPVQVYRVAQLESSDLQMQLSSDLECMILLTMGLVRYYAEDLPEAIGHFAQALERDTTNDRAKSRLHFFRGTAYLWSGVYDQAIADYASAIQFDPIYAAAYGGLGLTYAHLGLYDQAIPAYDVATQLDPSHAAAYYGLGRAYVALGVYEQALSSFTQAIDRDYVPAYVSRGNAYFNRGNYDEALVDYQCAIKADGEYALAHSQLGHVHFSRREYGAAVPALKRAIEPYESRREHAPIELYYTLGFAYYYLDQCDRAIPWFERALEIDAEEFNALEGIRICEQAEVAP